MRARAAATSQPSRPANQRSSGAPASTSLVLSFLMGARDDELEPPRRLVAQPEVGVGVAHPVEDLAISAVGGAVVGGGLGGASLAVERERGAGGQLGARERGVLGAAKVGL